MSLSRSRVHLLSSPSRSNPRPPFHLVKERAKSSSHGPKSLILAPWARQILLSQSRIVFFWDDLRPLLQLVQRICHLDLIALAKSDVSSVKVRDGAATTTDHVLFFKLLCLCVLSLSNVVNLVVRAIIYLPVNYVIAYFCFS